MTVTITLPCETGTTVYMTCNGDVVSGIIDRFIIGDAGIPVADICLENGEWAVACKENEYFLTEAEALEEIKSEPKLKKRRKKESSCEEDNSIRIDRQEALPHGERVSGVRGISGDIQYPDEDLGEISF